LEYKELLKEYLDNLGVDDYKAADMRKARTDFKNTLKIMYGKTKFPQKSYCEEFNTTKDIIEDFVDTTLITGLTTSLPSTQITGGELVFNVDGTVLYVNSLNDMDTIVVALRRISSASPPPTISISIDNQLGENLFTQSQNIVSDGDYTFTPGLTDQCNFIVTITISKSNDTSINLQTLTFTFAKKSLVLPSDAIIPLRIIFTSQSNRELASSEIRLSEYEAWIPFRFTDPQGITSQVTDPKERYVTRENLLYDRAIGYLFLPDPDKVTLWWKPAIKGKVTLIYSSLPVLNIDEGTFNAALEAFSDILVAGATWRGLRRKLLESKTTQTDVTLAALNLSIRDYKSEFNKRMQDWVEFTKSRSTTVIIEAFDFLNDTDMLRV